MTTDTTSLPMPARISRFALTRQIISDPLTLVALIVLGIIILASIAAPVLTSYDPARADLSAALLPAGAEHLLGTDASGRDILARLLYGGRYTLLGATVALVTAALIGVTAGLIAGYFGGVFNAITTWLASLLMALPGIIVLLAARASIGQSLWGIMLILGVILSPSFFRLTQTIVNAVRAELFVDAARVSGVSDARIIGVHVTSVVRGPLIIQAAMVLGIAINVQAGLEFLALGDRDLPSWGAMLNEAFTRIYSDPQLLLWPALAITVTTAALIIFSNGLRDSLTPGAPAVTRKHRELRRRLRAANAGIASDDDSILLSVDSLSVGYPEGDGTFKQVVDGVSFGVREGEILGLVGESGSGKSQTAFAIMGVLPAGGSVIGGSLTWRGDALTPAVQKASRGRRFAYIPQEPLSNLDPMFTIGHQLTSPLRHTLGLSKREAKQRSIALLERVGIVEPERVMKSYPHEISGGMAQRVLIAGAVSCDPDLLIADEPTTALDVTVQAEVLDLLRSLQQERQMAVLLVTHNLGVVADICDRVAVMKNGRIVETGATETLFASPEQPYTKALLSAVVDGTDLREPYEEVHS